MCNFLGIQSEFVCLEWWLHSINWAQADCAGLRVERYTRDGASDAWIDNTNCAFAFTYHFGIDHWMIRLLIQHCRSLYARKGYISALIRPCYNDLRVFGNAIAWVKPSPIFWLAIHISSHIIICVHHMPEATSIIRNPEFQRPSLDTGLGVLSLSF